MPLHSLSLRHKVLLPLALVLALFCFGGFLSTHFIQRALAQTMEADTKETLEIVNTLRKRRDAAVTGLNAIQGVSVATPNSTFYLFPNVTEVMKRKGYTDVNRLMTEALERADVSFCTRKHFGKPLPGEAAHYIRFAYSGLDTADIREGMKALKGYFES